MNLLHTNNSRLVFWIVFLLAVILYFGWLGATPIYILDEAKNAQCAREMYENGNWVVPVFNGILRTDKPPLHYWFMGLGYALFGINEFAARFFSATAGVATVIVLFFFARRYFGLRIAFLCALIFLSSLNLSLEMHYAVPDPYLILWLSSAMFSIFHFMISGKKKFCYLFYVLIALAVLTKGPVAIVMPGLIIGIYLLMSRQFSLQAIWRLKPLIGALIVLVISLPWYYAVHKATGGEWTNGFFLEHNLQRFTKIKEGHGGFFLMTIVFVILGLLPFSAFIFQAFTKAWKDRNNPVILFSFVSSMVFILFFTISQTKLPNYTMPCYPLVAILLGYYLQNKLGPGLRNLKLPMWILLVLMMVLPFALWFAINMEPLIRDMKWYALAFLSLPLTVGIALIFLYRNQFNRFFLALSGGFMLVSLFFLAFVYPKVYERNPVRQSLGFIVEGYPVVAYRDFNPGYIFYLGKPIPVLQTDRELDSAASSHEHLIILTQERETGAIEKLGMKKVYEGKNIFETPFSKLYRK